MKKPVPAIRTIFWGLTYGAITLFAGTVGFAIAVVLPDGKPSRAAVVQGENTQEGNPSQALRSLLGKGLIPYRLSRPVNLVIMGIDRVPDAAPGSPESFASRSDTLLVARLDPAAPEATLLSIPRDTQVEIPGYGLTKINHANWFGGPQLVRDVIRHNFGGLEVDRYVRVDTGAFRDLVDLVGGIEVYVPQDMHYSDDTQKLYIDLQAGWQTLNGDQAEQFARFRHDFYGDIGRVQRQQMLLKALQNKLVSPAMVARLPELLEVFQSHVDTNLTLEEMIALAGTALQLNDDQLQMVMLPGRASSPEEFAASYWLMDPLARDRVLADYFDHSTVATQGDSSFAPMVDSVWGSPVDGAAGSLTENPALSAWGEPQAVPLQELRIAVQNASGTPNQGYRVAEILANQGFSNVYVIEDWPETVAESLVIVQRGDRQAAQSLQASVGFGSIEASSTGDPESDLTIRLGQDSFAAAPPEASGF